MTDRPFLFAFAAACCGAGLLAGPCAASVATWAYKDGAVPADGFVVDTDSQQEVLSFYNAIYLASEGAETRIGWTGSYSQNANGTLNCNRGTTNPAFKEDVRRRVNWFRAMAGLPADVTFDATPAVNDGGAGKPVVAAGTAKVECTQASAYMNAVTSVFYPDRGLSHLPGGTTHFCYSSSAWNGSSHSNLTVGYFGPKAIDVYIADDDLGDDQSNNVNMGHRRWILYSRAKDMATGDVPASTIVSGGTAYPVLPANALYILGTHKEASEAETKFTSWPPSGWTPKPLMPLRWTLARAGTTFPTTASSITLTGPTGNIPVTVLSSNVPDTGDNTLVFQPQSMPAAPGGAQTIYTATVRGISGNGAPSSYTWTVRPLAVDSTGVDQTITVPPAPPAVGAVVSYTPVPAAARYEVATSRMAVAGNHVEGAESVSPDILVKKTGSYAFLQGAVSTAGYAFNAAAGAKAFHLAFPLESTEPDYAAHDQSFEFTPEFVPAANSQITFFEHFRWLFTTNRLSLEISTDGGVRWAEIYGRNGAYTYSPNANYTSTGWDKAWLPRTVSLSAYAGVPLKARFILRQGNLAFDGDDIGHGCFLDAITLTNVRRVVPGSSVTGRDTAVLLSSAAHQGGLVAGDPVLLRVRPDLGGVWMGYSPPLTITPTGAVGYAAWVDGVFPGLGIGGADDDGDGVTNLMEYALGFHPLDATSGPGEVPVPRLDKAALLMNFDCPPGVTGVNYSAEISTDLTNWNAVPDTGTSGACFFSVPLKDAGPNAWMRLRVTAAP